MAAVVTKSSAKVRIVRDQNGVSTRYVGTYANVILRAIPFIRFACRPIRCLAFPRTPLQRESLKAAKLDGMFQEASAAASSLKEEVEQRKTDAKRMAQEVRLQDV